METAPITGTQHGRALCARRPRPRWSTESGFTAVDILTAVCLSVVLSAIAVPSGSQLFRHYQFAGAINQLAADLSRARVQAVAQNRFVRVRFLGGNRYAIERSSDGVSYAAYGSAITLPSHVTVGGDTPTFDRSGLPTAVTTVSVSNGQASKSIRINLVGAVSIL